MHAGRSCVRIAYTRARRIKGTKRVSKRPRGMIRYDMIQCMEENLDVNDAKTLQRDVEVKRRGGRKSEACF